jgi:NSS family neurotransmitter:Na+ symporter
MIFPALFAMEMDPAGGPGLVFVVLPSIFARMPLGDIFGAGFFLLLTIAALTSTISLLEVPVAFLVDEWHWKRRNAVFAMAALAFILGVPSALSLGAVGSLSKIPLIGIGFLDLANVMMGNYSLTFGAMLIALFVAYKWGVKSVMQEIEQQGVRFHFKDFWSILIRFICPVAILLIFVYIIWTRNYF